MSVTIIADTRPLLSTHRRFGRLSLRVTGGPDRGKQFRLDIDRTRPIRGGRGPHNDLVLTDDSVSSEHFELRAEAAAVVLRDLGSTNGIRLGGARVPEAWLVPSNRFSVGDSELELVSADQIEAPLWPEDHFEGMYGRSMPMRELFVQLDKIARQDGKLGRVPVLLGGPTGTGKELAARAIHARSSRRDRPFVTLNCSAISPELAESLLFGHARGSFTGAHEARDGVFETANGGTLFLDEIGELSLDLQAKLLRPLELDEVLRVGEHAPRKVDVRVIAATHRNLIKMIEQARFREDLFYRIHGIFLELPSLRERGDDVIVLAERFLEDLLEGSARRLRLSLEARGLLRGEQWPGNVRQLQRVIQRAAIVADGPEIRRKDLALDVTNILGTNLDLERVFNMPVREAGDEFERKYYRRLLGRFRTRAEAARFAGVTPEGLRVALRRLGLSDAEEPKP